MSYTAAKELGNETDIHRFACCFLNSENTQAVRISPPPKPTHHSRQLTIPSPQVNWDAAAAQYDPKVKTASFKTVTLRALKKVEAAAKANGATIGNGAEVKEKKAAGGAKGAKKRKAAEVQEDADEEAAAAETTVAKKGKKGAAAKRGGKKGAAVVAAADVEEGDGEDGEAEGDAGREVSVKAEEEGEEGVEDGSK
ncbi:hypothetical protein BDY17DRAFT_311032 [Neohortaea acidophila]|uniref:Uncharacterized protein n=1 Tax=Neohortaea acidophila TaxID=245834 RepID=A0A6A6PR26_9PEZI|nr:uncharacterized protein BDY17DRAFT_311032 [Neohortaea acidophila]KAF2482578.1 hypothetical protein BDY17DRAFT_311032 [Neohortaea acidophila]